MMPQTATKKADFSAAPEHGFTAINIDDDRFQVHFNDFFDFHDAYDALKSLFERLLMEDDRQALTTDYETLKDLFLDLPALDDFPQRLNPSGWLFVCHTEGAELFEHFNIHTIAALETWFDSLNDLDEQSYIQALLYVIDTDIKDIDDVAKNYHNICIEGTSKLELAYNILESSDIPENFKGYIDLDKLGRDASFDYSCVEINGIAYYYSC